MKKVSITLLLLSCAYIIGKAQDNYITTIGGTGSMGYAGDNGPAVNCELYYPEAINLYKGGLYIADLGNGRIRKIDLFTGTVTTVAGVDSFGYSGDGEAATNAALKAPADVFLDMAGNIFIADGYNYAIRKVEASTGIITTVAGNGHEGYNGDGIPATNAELDEPSGVYVDGAGNIYIADYLNNRVRKVNATTGIITTMAGTGGASYSGDNDLATNATFNGPQKVCGDIDGNIYIADQWNSRVRKVDAASGIVTTIAGNGMVGYSGDGGLAENAKLSQPGGLFIDMQKNVYFAEYGNGVIRRVDGTTQVITTIAGNGTLGFSGDNGPATTAQLIPDGVSLDSLGTVYIADYDNMRIRKLYSPLSVHSLSKNDPSIFPNPTHNELNITGNFGESSYRVLSITGTCLSQGRLQKGNSSIPMESYMPGVYILELIDGNGSRNMTRVVKN